MKINVQKNALVAGLKKVSSVIGSKSTIPVISNVLAIAKDGKLVLHTTDLELSVKTEVDVEVLEEGSTTIPCKKLNEIVSKLPEGLIEISTDEKFQSKIKCNSSFFRIVGMNPKEFPIDTEPEQPRSFTIARNSLVKNLKKISYAASTDDARYVLNGVLFSIREGALTTVATDGRRLALVEKIIEGEGDLDGDAVLPMKAVQEVIKSIDGEGDLTINFSDNKASFITSDTVVISKLVDGNYPNFRHVIPNAFNFSATIPRGPFTSALERVSLVVSESNLSITVDMSAVEACLSSSSSEIGEAEERLGIDYNGTPMKVTFNPKFLADPLKNLECDNMIIQLNDGNSPVAVCGDEGFLYIIMPMRS